MACSKCSQPKKIVNVKYNLCDNCNSIRLTGKSLQERQAESVTKYREKAFKRYPSGLNKQRTFVTNTNRKCDKKPIRQQTKKEAGVKSQLSILKTSIELEAIQSGEYYCKGCGKSQSGLDKSHILSVGQYKHLELLKANIQLLCRNDHIIWESGTIEQQMRLHCFVDNLRFIYTVEPLVHQKFVTRMEEYKAWLIPEKDKGKIEWVEGILAEIMP